MLAAVVTGLIALLPAAIWVMVAAASAAVDAVVVGREARFEDGRWMGQPQRALAEAAGRLVIAAAAAAAGLTLAAPVIYGRASTTAGITAAVVIALGALAVAAMRHRRTWPDPGQGGDLHRPTHE